MSFFGKFFKRAPASLQLSDWLGNMTEAFLRMGDDVLSQDKSSPNMLVCFTTINTTHTAHKILHAAPQVAWNIGPIYAELRAYYECLWQLILLHQYTKADDHEKLSRLCGDVTFRLEQTMELLFQSNPNVKKALSVSIGKSFEKIMINGVKEYIHGERTHWLAERRTDITANVAVNVQVLLGKIERLGSLDKSSADAINKILVESTAKAFQMIFLTQFDFHKCEVLPDEFYR